jgi:predicted transcriptional regulator
VSQLETVRDPATRLVRDAMQLHLVCVVPEMTVRELTRVLLENSISGAPVVDEVGKVLGVVSATDILRLGAAEPEIPSGQVEWNPLLPATEIEADADSSWEADIDFTAPTGSPAEGAFDTCTVRDIMTPVAFTVRPIDTAATAVSMMRRGRVHRLLVMEDGFLHGIITPFDILEMLGWE